MNIKSESAPGYDVQRHTDDSIIAEAMTILRGRLRKPDSYINNPDDAKQLASLQLAEREHEVFCVMWLDNRHGMLAFQELFRGTIDSGTVPPREVVKEGLAVNAAACLLVHNHPSGNPEPSQADQRITHRLRDALTLIDIRVLDHLVIGGTDTVSFAERGLI